MSIFCAPTPRRRIINTAIFLVLVLTIIPYQFAYMVACVIHLITCVRAQWYARETVCFFFCLSHFFTCASTDEDSGSLRISTSPTMPIRYSCSCCGFCQSMHWSFWSGFTTSWCIGSCLSHLIITFYPSCRLSFSSKP